MEITDGVQVDDDIRDFTESANKVELWGGKGKCEGGKQDIG